MSTSNIQSTTQSTYYVRTTQSTPDVSDYSNGIVRRENSREGTQRQTDARAYQHRDSTLSRADDEQRNEGHKNLIDLARSVAADEGVAQYLSQDPSVEQSFQQLDQLVHDQVKSHGEATYLRQQFEEKLSDAIKDEQVIRDRAERLKKLQESARQAAGSALLELEQSKQASEKTFQAWQNLAEERAVLEQLEQQAQTQHANYAHRSKELTRRLEELEQGNAQAENDLAVIPKLEEEAQRRTLEVQTALKHASDAEHCAKYSREALEQSVTAEVRHHVSLAKARQAVRFDTEVEVKPTTTKVTPAPVTPVPISQAPAPTAVPPVVPIADSRSVQSKQTTTKTATDANGYQVKVTDKHATKDSTDVQTKPAGCLTRCRDRLGCVKPSKTVTANAVTTTKTVEEKKASNAAVNVRDGTTKDSQGRHVKANGRE